MIDEKNNQIVIADTAGGSKAWQFDPALVVVNLKTGESRRILAGHRSVQAEPIDAIIEGQTLMVTVDKETGKQIPSRWGVNELRSTLRMNGFITVQ